MPETMQKQHNYWKYLAIGVMIFLFLQLTIDVKFQVWKLITYSDFMSHALSIECPQSVKNYMSNHDVEKSDYRCAMPSSDGTCYSSWEVTTGSWKDGVVEYCVYQKPNVERSTQE